MAIGIARKREEAAVDVVEVEVESEAGAGARPADPNGFDRLVLALKEALGPSSGLTSADVDVPFLTRLMEEYEATEGGWQPYNLGDASRGYTRNLVDEGNGKSNLVRRCGPLERQSAG